MALDQLSCGVIPIEEVVATYCLVVAECVMIVRVGSHTRFGLSLIDFILQITRASVDAIHLVIAHHRIDAHRER